MRPLVAFLCSGGGDGGGGGGCDVWWWARRGRGEMAATCVPAAAVADPGGDRAEWNVVPGGSSTTMDNEQRRFHTDVLIINES